MDLNRGKVGHPFKLTVRYVEFLMVVRYLFSMPYRQLEGFTRALNRLIPKLPSVDYSWVRRRILMLNPSLYDSLRVSNEPVTIAVDSSSVSVHKSGGWVTRMYGRRKRYIKIHFAVNVKTRRF
ncbi:MAG: transposase [Candidatus Methanomethylicia archaeon]